jgi:hypothetical protein
MAVAPKYAGVQKRIAAASSCEELVELANDYLASWDHGELALLPDACRPTRVRDVDDLFYWSDRLSETYVGGTVVAPEGVAMRTMVGFFLSAATQASRIQRNT